MKMVTPRRGMGKTSRKERKCLEEEETSKAVGCRYI